MKKKKIRRADRAFFAALSYVSPRWNTKLLFLRKFGRLPDLKHPQTLNEKLLKQKLERFGTDPIVRRCADKYRVRDYVDGCGCGGTLNRLLAVYDRPEDIDWDALPERAKGPLSVRSRYIMEDVPQGLGLLESLGASLGVPTPVCSSLIEIASAALGCDLRAQGRTIERLGRDNIRAILADAERGADVCPDGMR